MNGLRLYLMMQTWVCQSYELTGTDRMAIFGNFKGTRNRI